MKVKVVPVCAIKACCWGGVGVEVRLHSLLTLTLDLGERVTARTNHFTPDTRFMEGLVSPGAVWACVKKRKSAPGLSML